MASTLLCLVVAACASTPTGVAQPTPTATATPTPTVLFTADFSRGLAGWQATPGWTVTDGALESSTAPGLSLVIPYQPPAGNYTVEIDLQVVSVAQNGGYYTLVVPPSPPADGYFAGVVHLVASGPRPNGDHPTIVTGINPSGDQDRTPGGNLPVADFEPGTGVGNYQFQIVGPSVSLYVNGNYYVEADSTNATPLATGPLKLTVSGAQVRITAIKVIA